MLDHDRPMETLTRHYPMDSYLIRIYRRSPDEPEKIVGIIEEISTGHKRSFKDLSELCNAVAAPKPEIKTGIPNHHRKDRKT